MRKRAFFYLLFPLVLLNISGCAPLIVGGAVGALGAYAVSKDTVQGDTDKSYDSLWNAAYTVGRIRGTIKQEDSTRGDIGLQVGASKVSIRLIRLTHLTTRIKISARNKFNLPNRDLAEDIFVKIMEEAK